MTWIAYLTTKSLITAHNYEYIRRKYRDSMAVFKHNLAGSRGAHEGSLFGLFNPRPRLQHRYFSSVRKLFPPMKNK